LLLAAVVAPGTAKAVAEDALQRGLVVNPVSDNAIRFAPSLLVTDDEIDEAVTIFAETLQ
jgi:4-aminobutyrate aminotransferase-like enzyme